MRHARGQSADRRHGLRLAQPLLGLPTRRHVGIQRDEAAARQRIAPDFELPATRPRPLDRAHGGAGAQQRQAPRDLGLDIDRAELAAGHLAAQDILHRQADTQDVRRHAGELREVLVPRHQPKIAIDHHDAVAHAGQRRLENRPLARQRLVPAAGGVLRAQQQQRQQQDQQRDAAGEQQRVRLPVCCRPHRLGAIDADHDLQVADPERLRRRRSGRHRPDRDAPRPASLGRLDASPRRWACWRCRSPWAPGQRRPCVQALPSRMLTTAIRPCVPRSTSR